jgi:hypothetical protein
MKKHFFDIGANDGNTFDLFLNESDKYKNWSRNNPREGKEELQFFWKENFTLDIINNDLLGPTVDAVIGYYDELIK